MSTEFAIFLLCMKCLSKLDIYGDKAYSNRDNI